MSIWDLVTCYNLQNYERLLASEFLLSFFMDGWIYKSGPGKSFEKNYVGKKQKTDEFFVRGRGCRK